jgi:pre-rRNA-processing protein TSR4
MMMAGNSSKRLNAVQLGFSVAFEDHEHGAFVGHNLPLWRDWDGGQIGGRPSWLQPRDLPKDFLACKNCDEPLCFVCQLYAPVDEVNPEAFHRSMYIFACPNKQCAGEPTGSIRVLRTQLPQKNSFYPEDHDETWSQHLPEAWEVNLCRVCGQRGKGKCPVQGYHFCGKHHQKEHKNYIFDKQQLSKKLEFNFLPSVYSESELVVEEEPSGAENVDVSKPKKALFPTTNEDDDGDDDSDKDLEQEDLNEMTGAAASTVSKDATTMDFYARVKGVPDVQEQVLRYLRWPDRDLALDTSTPLWIRSDHQPKNVPDCPHCGAERKFEFQVMPQMLHYLLKDLQMHRAHAAMKQSISASDREALMKASSIMEQAPPEQIPPDFADSKEKAIRTMKRHLMGDDDKEFDWGVVAVYTCTKSCCGGVEMEENAELGAYIEEFAWKQPSLDA